MDHAVIPSAVDALIVGSGPAGASTAIFLARAGWKVLLLAREETAHPGVQKIGESLSPEAQVVLKELGVWDTFLADGHLPCFANKSAWGSARLEYHDFIRNPLGNAWHIDRRLFERRLMERANESGVRQMDASLREAMHEPDGWRVRLSNGQAMSARWIVDASGRVSAFARRQGVKRVYEDRQIAAVAFLQPGEIAASDSTTLVETIPDGWWYSALLPGGNLVAALMTDADLHSRDQLTDQNHWLVLLSRTRHTSARVSKQGFRLTASPRVVAAESSRLESLFGDGWLAVGDAAVAYDPLSSHGLTMAMVGGRDAARAILAEFSGEKLTLHDYDARLNSAFVEYSAMRARLYRAEKRWPNSPYWRKRA